MLQPLADLLQTADTTTDEPTPPAPDTEEWAAGTDASGGLQDMFDIDDVDDQLHHAEPAADDGPSQLSTPVPITHRQPHGGDVVESHHDPRPAHPARGTRGPGSRRAAAPRP
jgi:hypothetical protein